MAPSREELRDDLRAMVAAAPELSEEERDHLADVFLDRLESEYRLVPRGQGAPEPARSSPGRGGLPFRGPGMWPVALLALGVAAALWVLATSIFVVAHPPVFLFVILIFLALRVFRPWGPRRRMYR